MMKQVNLIYFRHNQYGFASAIQPRELLYYDLTLVLDGILEYQINGKTVILQSGDVLFLRIGELRGRCCGKDKSNYISFNFHSDREYDLPHVIKKGISREIRYLIAACDEVGGISRAETERKLEHILHCMLMLLEERPSTAFSDMTERILSYLHAHLTDKITLEGIGKEMHFSPVYCDTVFKKEVGKSIFNYFLDMRIDQAKRQLLENQESVSKIAHRVGFEDHNYFSRLFKQRVGYTPTQYRSSILKDYEKKKEHEKS